MIVSACGKGKEAQTKTKVTKPVKELTLEEKVVGEYEIKEDGNTGRLVLLENGIAEAYLNGKKAEDEGKWKIVDGEIHADDGGIVVFSINKGSSITAIAQISKDGKRRNIPKDNQIYTHKKIK